MIPGQRVHHEILPAAGVLQEIRIVGRQDVGAGVEGVARIASHEADVERSADGGCGIGHQREGGVGEEASDSTRWSNLWRMRRWL